MRIQSREELEKICPLENGIWNRENLYEYLVQSCDRRWESLTDAFFKQHSRDEKLADLLFGFLLNDDYDGSDCQMGAAYYIARLDREVLRKKKALLLLAQENEVSWKRPFQDEEYREWL